MHRLDAEAMRVAQFCYRYFPERGGSEVYVRALADGLRKRGVESIVICAGARADVRTVSGVTVICLGDPYAVDTADPSGSFVRRFETAIHDWAPDLVHYHWIPRLADGVLAGPKVPSVLTYHHPNISCLRTDLLRHGRDRCSGALDADACLRCVARFHGAPGWFADGLAALPESVPDTLRRMLPAGRLGTAFAIASDTRRIVGDTRAFLRSHERVFALSEHSRSVLAAAGVEPDRVVLCRLGRRDADPDVRALPRACNAAPVRGVFMGRVARGKGLSLLEAATSDLDPARITIDVYGPIDPDNPADAIVAQGAGPDRGVLAYRGEVQPERVLSTLAAYDVAIVPSLIVETGPFSVIEALQVGLPVVGSDLPGINEMVEHDRNGWLARVGDVDAWREALHRIADQPESVNRWADRAKWDRTFDDVATETVTVYQECGAAGPIGSGYRSVAPPRRRAGRA